MVGAVLAGGASRRMGTDKALVPVDGEPMVARVVAALGAAGAKTVVLVGASREVADAVGLATVPDDDPGSGPLGGLSTALAWAAVRAGAATGEESDPLRAQFLTRTGQDRPLGPKAGPIVLVAACDQPELVPAGLAALVAALDQPGEEALAARFATADGRRHPLPSAWRVDLAAGSVADLHAAGERRIGAAFDAVTTVELFADGADLFDLDTPADLARWQEHRRPPPGDPWRRP